MFNNKLIDVSWSSCIWFYHANTNSTHFLLPNTIYVQSCLVQSNARLQKLWPTTWREDKARIPHGCTHIHWMNAGCTRIQCRKAQRIRRWCGGAVLTYPLLLVSRYGNKPLWTRHGLPFLIVVSADCSTAYKHLIDVSQSGWFRSYNDHATPLTHLWRLPIHCCTDFMRLCLD